MKFLNKYETVGIFLSIFVMIAVLGAARLKAEIASVWNQKGTDEGVVESHDKSADFEQALLDAYDPTGELVKLVINDLRVGTGEEVEKGDTVVIHYMGETNTGERFVDSYRKDEPYTFTVGEGKMIEGIEKGILGMKVGGERVLVVPHTMAYGNHKVGVIPPRAVLVFTIELLEIK